MSWDTYVLTMPNQLHALGISVCLSGRETPEKNTYHKVGYLNTNSSLVEPQSSNSKVSRSFNNIDFFFKLQSSNSPIPKPKSHSNDPKKMNDVEMKNLIIYS